LLLGPLAVAIFLSRKPIDFVWAALALVGIVLMVPFTEAQDRLDPLGVAFTLGAAVAWAFYILIGKKAGANTHSGTVTTLGMSVGFVAVLPFGAADIGPVWSDSKLALAAVGVGLLSSALPYSLEMMSLKKLSAKHFGILLSLEPAVGALAGYFFLHEQLSLTQCGAMACIMAASIGCTIAARKKAVETVVSSELVGP